MGIRFHFGTNSTLIINNLVGKKTRIQRSDCFEWQKAIFFTPSSQCSSVVFESLFIKDAVLKDSRNIVGVESMKPQVKWDEMRTNIITAIVYFIHFGFTTVSNEL